MEIYLMRHGEAVSPADWNGPDSSRPLADQGRQDLAAAVVHMTRVHFKPRQIISSPLQRSVQTTEAIQSISASPKPQVNSLLAAGASLEAYQSVLLSERDNGGFLIVGHLPDLVIFSSFVTSDPWILDPIHMDPGEIWALETGDHQKVWGNGKILWRRQLADWASLG